MDERGPPSSPPPPRMVIDGFDHDLALAKSHVLTREEVLRRRLRRVKQLSRCYRGQYWALMEELKLKFREYYWVYGKSPFKEDHKAPCTEGAGVTEENVDSNKGNQKGLLGSDGGVGDDIVRCAASGCKTKAMALTRYCYNHILSDPKQVLYRGCGTVAKNLPQGPSYCNKPVLKSMVPPACPTHFLMGEKCLIRAVKRAGYTLPSNRKPNPKLHVLISEYVRHIQSKRKVALKGTVPKAEPE